MQALGRENRLALPVILLLAVAAVLVSGSPLHPPQGSAPGYYVGHQLE